METMSEATAAQDVSTPEPAAAEPVKLLDDPARDVPNGREPAAPARQNTETSEAPSSATEGDSGGVADPEQAEADNNLAKGRHHYTRKIDQLTRDVNEWKRVAMQNSEALARANPAPTQQAPASAPQPAAPTPDQFPNFTDYLVAQSKYESRQEAKGQIDQWQQGLQTTIAQQQRVAEQTRREAVFQAAWAADKATIPDYDAVVSSSRIDIADHVGAAIKSVDTPAKVIRYLAENPSIVDSLNGMEPPRAFIEMGKISAKLATATSRTSNAPAPGQPVQPRAAAGSNWYREDMSGEEYAAEKRKRAKRT